MPVLIWLLQLSVEHEQCQKFVRFYLFFFSLNSFFPRTLILLTHVLFPLFHFIFTIHTKSEPL